MRVQFYPKENLKNKLVSESELLGVGISVLVEDILNKHYGLVSPDKLSDIEIEQKVFNELKEFVKNAKVDEEFDLNKASETYKKISMVYDGKPRILKARLGKKFAKNIGTLEFANVQQVRNPNGEPKRTVSNRAAIYKIIE